MTPEEPNLARAGNLLLVVYLGAMMLGVVATGRGGPGADDLVVVGMMVFNLLPAWYLAKAAQAQQRNPIWWGAFAAWVPGSLVVYLLLSRKQRKDSVAMILPTWFGPKIRADDEAGNVLPHLAEPPFADLRDTYLELMQFPAEWLAWDMLPEEFLAGQMATYEPGQENAAEHDRHGVFQWWLRQAPPAERLVQLARLTWLDPDSAMAASVRDAIATQPAFSPAVAAAIATPYARDDHNAQRALLPGESPP